MEVGDCGSGTAGGHLVEGAVERGVGFGCCGFDHKLSIEVRGGKHGGDEGAYGVSDDKDEAAV